MRIAAVKFYSAIAAFVLSCVIAPHLHAQAVTYYDVPTVPVPTVPVPPTVTFYSSPPTAAAPAPTVTYYGPSETVAPATLATAPPTVTYYSPAPAAAPIAAPLPTVTYYPSVVTVPATPVTTYYAPAPQVRPGLFGWRARRAQRRAYWNWASPTPTPY